MRSLKSEGSKKSLTKSREGMKSKNRSSVVTPYQIRMLHREHLYTLYTIIYNMKTIQCPWMVPK
jgi:hypothetical protein